MRVVAVTTWFPTVLAPRSGAFVVQDLKILRDAGRSVDVVHLVPPHQDDGTRYVMYDGLRVRRVPMSTTKPLQITRAAVELRRLLAGADLVHSMAFSSLLPLAIAPPHAPWVHTEHWSGLTTPATLPAAWRTVLPVLERLLARPDVVTAVCDFLAEPVRRVRGGRPTRVVPCVVPVPRPVPPRPARSDRLRLVSVGGLVERKDPLLAVETLAELARRGIPSELTWVGEGHLEDDVRRRARDLGVNVTLTGALPAAGVSAALAAADLFLGPTRADNFFVSCAEALVHGRPVVVGSNGGQREYVDPVVGVLVDRQDACAYADAVEAVDARTKDLDAATVAETVGDRFSPAVVAAGYAAAYEVAEGLR